MRTLWLARHAQAVAYEDSQQDKTRCLTNIGQGQALRLARLFQRDRARIDLMIVSPSVRTRQTASIIQGATIGVVQSDLVIDELYLASEQTLWNIIQKTDDRVESLLVVGHNPGLENLAAGFLPTPQRLDTADMIQIQFDCQSWRDAASENLLSAQKV